VPIYLIVIGMLSPWLGVIALVSAGLLFLTGLTNEFVTRRALREANAIGSESTVALRTILFGAESVGALGMCEAVLERRRSNERVLGLQSPPATAPV
jgi:ATP-binding cassette subfamily C exporter for protease/lipase